MKRSPAAGPEWERGRVGVGIFSLPSFVYHHEWSVNLVATTTTALEFYLTYVQNRAVAQVVLSTSEYYPLFALFLDQWAARACAVTIFGNLTATDWEDGWVWMNGWLEIAAAINVIMRFPFPLTEPFVSLRSSILWMPPYRYITCINDNLGFIPCVRWISSQTVTLLCHLTWHLRNNHLINARI